MAQEMNSAEQENLQALVHRIATHIVQGSAAVQELKSTVARLKNERLDIEYVVYEHWLKAAKTIEAAGKDRSSWEKFINLLKIDYGDDDKEASFSLSGWGAPKEDNNLLINSSKELWARGAANHAEYHNLVETVNHNDDHLKSEIGLVARNIKYLGEGSAYNDTEGLAWGTKPISESNYKLRSKRKGYHDSNELDGKSGKKKTYIRFKDGRKLGGERVSALKKGGRCFYCERKGHRAWECKENPDVQRKQ